MIFVKSQVSSPSVYFQKYKTYPDKNNVRSRPGFFSMKYKSKLAVIHKDFVKNIREILKIF